MSGPISTGIGDRLADKPPQYFSKPPRPTQPPALSGTGNKFGDAMRLGADLYRSFHAWINVLVADKLCDRSLTRAV